MQQKDIKQLKQLLERYALMLLAEGETSAVANVTHVVRYIEEDLKQNQR